MKVMIHALLGPLNPRGVGRYADEIVKAMAKMAPHVEFIVVIGVWMTEYQLFSLKAPNVTLKVMNAPRGRWRRNLWNVTVFPRLVKQLAPDVLHIIDTSPITRSDSPIVSTIHDLAEYRVPQKYSTLQGLFRKLIVKHQARVSNQIIAVSRATADDLSCILKIPDQKVSVVPNGVSELCPLADRKNMEIKGKYILFVGQMERTKNVPKLIEAFGYARGHYAGMSDVRLVIVGGDGNDSIAVHDALNESQYQEWISLLGYVDNDTLECLYTKATLFAYLSEFEGFGLPILEALKRGAPVICSDIPVFHEIAGDAAVYVQLETKAIADGLYLMIEDTHFRERLVEEGQKRVEQFSWEATATETLNVYRKVSVM